MRRLIIRYGPLSQESKRVVAHCLREFWRVPGVVGHLAAETSNMQYVSVGEDGLAFAYDNETGPFYFYTATRGDPSDENNIVACIKTTEPFVVVLKDKSLLPELTNVLGGYVSEYQVTIEIQVDKK